MSCQYRDTSVLHALYACESARPSVAGFAAGANAYHLTLCLRSQSWWSGLCEGKGTYLSCGLLTGGLWLPLHCCLRQYK